jgi:predicted MPP superfamily phosphohydrolase
MSSPEAHRQAPRRHGSARLAFFRTVERAAERLGGRRFYHRRFLTAGGFEVRHESVVTTNPALVGLRFVQLSDIHAGPFLGSGDLAEVVAAANACRPDVCFFTGDLIARHTEEAWLVLDDLAQLEAPGGVLGVFGNHDYRGRREREIAARYGARGIRFLFNESVRPLEGLPLVVLGLEDLEEARALDVEPARVALRPGDFELILCHNPLGAATLAGPHTGLVLSGHAHGNQIDLPLVRRVGPGHPGDRIDVPGPSGLVPLITSRGLGTVGLPLRLFARPDIVCIELVEAGP